MGPLIHGTLLDWPTTCLQTSQAKINGIEQFLNVYNTAKDFDNYAFKWGDEIEYMLLRFDDKFQTVKLSLSSHNILPQLQKDREPQSRRSFQSTLWTLEFAQWMIEGLPGVPYRDYVADLANVERNMVLRRKLIAELLGKDDAVMTLSAFPRIGCGVFTSPATKVFDPRTRSFLVSDEVCSLHPRFSNMIEHLRLRRGSNVHVSIPLFLDKCTARTQSLIPEEESHQILLKKSQDLPGLQTKQQEIPFTSILQGFDITAKDSVLMDSSIFGAGCCCLQVTLQAANIQEGRHLYDQLAVIAPLMLALTAATPAIRGMLVDTDTRWYILSASLDDRTPDEISSGVLRSRHGSINCFLSSREQYETHLYNDIPIPVNRKAYTRLKDAGVDHFLAQHVANIFARDPLILFKESLARDNTTSTEQYDNLQSTNWNSVRLKIPPPGTDIGWRVEFRSMEVGLTDFENAAYAIFVVILSRVILAYNLNLYIPISKVDENMARSSQRDAINTQLFYFRQDVFLQSVGNNCSSDRGRRTANASRGQNDYNAEILVQNVDRLSLESDSMNKSCVEMSLNEIFNGKQLCRNGSKKMFPGLITLMKEYVRALEADDATRTQILRYIDFVSDRASGKLCTNATYVRQFIRSHKAYKMDSVVSDEICYDLLKHLQGITKGTVQVPELLGEYYSKSSSKEVETPVSMMKRMQKKWEGNEAGLLVDAAVPEIVLRDLLEGKIPDQPNC